MLCCSRRSVLAGALLLLGRGGGGGGVNIRVSAAESITTEVLGNGDIAVLKESTKPASEEECNSNTCTTTDNKEGQRRVSADAAARFPVTDVEKQPDRMVVIGDVHGDLGKEEKKPKGAGQREEGGSRVLGSVLSWRVDSRRSLLCCLGSVVQYSTVFEVRLVSGSWVRISVNPHDLGFYST